MVFKLGFQTRLKNLYNVCIFYVGNKIDGFWQLEDSKEEKWGWDSGQR